MNALAQMYLDKALAYLDRFEKHQLKAIETESAALERAKAAGHDIPPYFAARELEQDFWYKRTVANRNGNQLAANTYFMASIAVSLAGENDTKPLKKKEL